MTIDYRGGGGGGHAVTGWIKGCKATGISYGRRAVLHDKNIQCDMLYQAFLNSGKDKGEVTLLEVRERGE